ncbi:MAG: MarR family transcriptional regulator [Flavobacteriales bacterium]|jgi:DNA-binding MarR family transcriptional regulator|nr:MarR family transcriptional regulator [Flavobacteriales bacterium]
MPPRIDDELQSRFDNEQHKAMLNVMFTANWFKSRQTAVLRSHGISPQQYNILRILRGASGPMNMQAVKERMVERAPNATRLTDKLVTKALVERTRCTDDRRVVFVRITDRGLALLDAIARTFRPAQARMLAALSPADARELNRILDQCRQVPEPHEEETIIACTSPSVPPP